MVILLIKDDGVAMILQLLCRVSVDRVPSFDKTAD